jgi:hypothetical protein
MIRSQNNKPNSIFGDNYEQFSQFCRVQPNRDKRLSTALISCISQTNIPIRIFDIGSSDGGLAMQLYNDL